MSRGDNLRGCRPSGSGRKKGTPNKLTRDFKELVQRLIEDNEENFARWLAEVAHGKPAQVVNPNPQKGTPGGVIPGVAPDPAKALAIIAQLAEFVAPKQARTVIAADPENPAVQPIVNLTIGR